MFFPPFNQEISRYERKFVVSDLHYSGILQAVRIHPAAFVVIFHPRYINNIYLDSNELDFFYDNVSGKGSRKKARIRWYGDLTGLINKPVLEFKVREGFLGNKLSFPLKPFRVDETLKMDDLKKVFAESDLPEWAYEVLQYLNPSLLNRYSREYFSSFDEKFRLTIDSDLSYHAIEPTHNTFLRSYRGDDFIVEVKYDFANDKDADFVTNNLPFRLTKSSKYVNGMELLYPQLM
jgi:SPX domain protein involved in polyphosphate accumulation